MGTWDPPGTRGGTGTKRRTDGKGGRPRSAGQDAPGRRGVCAAGTCARARVAPQQTKPGPGEAAAGGPVRAHPPREAPPPAEGPRGGADARAPGPRRRHFVSSAQWGRVTAERGSKAGKEGMSQAPEREDWAEAGSAGRLRPCHLDSSADPALSGRRGGGRGRGGSGPGRRHIDSYLVRVPFSDRSRRPPARSRRGLAPKATRCAPGC